MITNGILSVTADDVQIQGTMTSGTAITNVHTTVQQTIGIGTLAEQMDIDSGIVGSDRARPPTALGHAQLPARSRSA